MKSKFLGVIILALFLSGCTGFRNDLNKANQKIEQRAAENNASAGQALQHSADNLKSAKILLDSAKPDSEGYTLSSNSFLNTGLYYDKALNGLELGSDFVTRNRKLLGEGSPEAVEVVDKLLSSNKMDQISGEIINNSNKRKEENIIKDKDEAIQKLIEYGAKYEKERNERILSYVKWGGISLLVIGSIVGFMFIPGVLPLIIGSFPALSGLFGVVTKTTANSMVKGIGEIRYSLKERIKMVQEFKNENPEFEDKWTTDEILELLDTELSKSMSDKDKNMIESLRKKLNL